MRYVLTYPTGRTESYDNSLALYDKLRELGCFDQAGHVRGRVTALDRHMKKNPKGPWLIPNSSRDMYIITLDT